MPEEVVPEALELDRKDTTDSALNRIRERTDNYDEEESDSNSEDGSQFSPESNEAAISRLGDSEKLEKTKLPTLFQSMSVGSDTSADSVDSIVPGERDFGAWIGSSSESSPCSSTSHLPSDSEDESSEDEERFNARANMRKKLNELGRDHNANYKATSKNNNNKEDESSSTRNIPVSSKNEESDVFASDDDSSDDSSDDSTNEDEVEVITRGPDEKLYSHNGKKPYNRQSPRYENTTEALTPDDGSSYNRSTPFSTQYEESDHASDDNSNDNYSKGEMEAEVPSWGPILSYDNGEIMCMSEDTTKTEDRSDLAEYITPDCDGLEYGEIIAEYCLRNHGDKITPVVDELVKTYHQISRHSPTEERPTFYATGSGDDNSNNSPPSIMINGTAFFPSESPQNTFRRTVLQPLSSASSLNSLENSESSPRSYVHDLDTLIGESIARDFVGLTNNESTSNINMHGVLCTQIYEPSQVGSPTQQLYPATLSDVANQTNVYTQSSDLVASMQGNVNICQSDVYTSSNIKMSTQAQMSPSQITGDSDSFGTTPPTQYQSNVLQHQPSTIQLFNGILPKANSLPTSWGIMKVTRRDEVEPKMTAIGQIRQVQTNNTINDNGGQTRKPIPKTNTRENTIPTAQPLTVSTNNDNSHLPATVEIINRQSSYEKKGSRRIDLWSLSRLPSTSAVETLKQKVPEINAQAAMSVLFQYRYDDYREQNEMGDTYLMSIVRNSIKLPSLFAYIAPVLDKMIKIPESLTMVNKEGHDALYLAAINCPEYSFVTGVIAATIEESCKSNDIWQRKYNHKKETLLHALAARGDSHVDVLLELLAVQKASKRTLFNLSAKNSDGKTPLHVAVEAHNLMRNVEVVNELMDCGASPIITDDKNGDTPLHMAMSNRPCLGIVQALLRKGGEKAVNIPNKMGNTPLDSATGFLSNVEPNTQREVYLQLIAVGGRTNILNR